jgi:hypothetical protein
VKVTGIAAYVPDEYLKDVRLECYSYTNLVGDDDYGDKNVNDNSSFEFK